MGKNMSRAPAGKWLHCGQRDESENLCRDKPPRGSLAPASGSVQGGSVDELPGVTVECPVFEQFQVEVGRSPEDRAHTGVTADDREYRQPVCGRPGRRPTVPGSVPGCRAVRAQRHVGLRLRPSDDPAERSMNPAELRRGRRGRVLNTFHDVG